MRFFRDNSDSIVKLYINQIGVAIFTMFLYTAAAAISVDGIASLLIKVGISAFSVLFYFALIYTVAWEIGAQDKIRIDAGRMEENKIKGFKLGIYANVPNFIFVGIALLLIGTYILSGVEVLFTVFGILNALFRIFVSMYLGIIQGLTDTLVGNLDFAVETALYLVFALIASAITYLSYLMGLKDKRLFPTTPKKK